MFFLCSLVVCLAVIGLSLLIHAAYAAPEGAEDDHGFYLTSPAEPLETVLPQTSMVTAADLVFFRQ